MTRMGFAMGLGRVARSAVGLAFASAIAVVWGCGGNAGGNAAAGGSSGAAGGIGFGGAGAGGAGGGLPGAGGAAGGLPGAGGAGGGQTGPTSELIGTWDVMATQLAQRQAITVTIAATGLSITSHSLSDPGGRQSSMIAIGANGVFDVAYAGPIRTAVYDFGFDPYGYYYPMYSMRDVYKSEHTIATRTGAPATDLGAMPFDLSGVWKIGQPYSSYGCMTSLDSNVVLANCNAVNGPSWMPKIERASMTGSRTPAPSAMFGMLGGTWNIQPLSGGACTVVIGDRSISATCVGTRDWASAGIFEITFGNAVASGRTNHGIEFAAQKR